MSYATDTTLVETMETIEQKYRDGKISSAERRNALQTLGMARVRYLSSEDEQRRVRNGEAVQPRRGNHW